LEKIAAWQKKFAGLVDNLSSQIFFTHASERDTGMYDAINKGFARFDIPPDAMMGWCNADDVMWPGAAAAVLQLADDLPQTNWVTGWPTQLDTHGRLVAIDRNVRFPQAILVSGLADGRHWRFVQQESTFWRKRLWDKVGGLNGGLRLAGDWDLWRRFAEHTSLTHAQRQWGSFTERAGQLSADVTSYQTEIEKILPIHQRRAMLRRSAQSLTSYPMAVEDSTGHWGLSEQCANIIAHITSLVASNLPTPWTMKLFRKLW
jgi:hypothetical protein